jgi:nicotinamide-nucleotide amidase
MDSVVLSIGSELLRGDIVDTNAAFLTRELTQLDFEVQWVEQIGDDLGHLRDAISRAFSMAQVTVCTGGLGPTQDDLTRQAIATALGEELQYDPSLVAELRARFTGLRRAMPESNLQQAMLIPSARPISNPNGTAPGWFVEKDGKRIIAMPGPPSEMQPMWRDSVVPQLQASHSAYLASRALMTFGIGESSLEDRITDLITWRPDVTVATYAKANGVQVHVTARASTASDAEDLAQEAEDRIRKVLGGAIFGTGDTTLSRVVGNELAGRKLTLATMESCSAGELANLITNTPGASKYFPGGIVAYTKETKIRYGVNQETMDKHGLISGETALAMAQAARRQLQSDVGIGLTGIAGSEPIEGKAPGTCFIAVTSAGGEVTRELHRPASRETFKQFVAQSALDLLRRHLTGIEDAT